MTRQDNDGVIRAVKDITAGSVGGIAQVLTGQPFDIVKVFLSLYNAKLGPFTNAAGIWTKGVCWGY